MNFIVDHVKELLAPMSKQDLQPKPKPTLSVEEVEKFWSYFAKFPNEFAAAVAQSLPDDVEFVQYDHLANLVTIK
jgi:hypothetical protein